MLNSMNVPVSGNQRSSVMQADWNFLRSNYPDAKLKNLYPRYPDFRKSRKEGVSMEETRQKL